MKALFKSTCVLFALMFSMAVAHAEGFAYLANIAPQELRSQILDSALTKDEISMLAFNYAFVFEFERVYTDKPLPNAPSPCYGRESECAYWFGIRGLVEGGFKDLDGAFSRLAKSIGVNKSVLLGAIGINLKNGENGIGYIDYQPNTTAINARNASWAYFYNYPTPNGNYPLNEYYAKTTPTQLFGQWYPEVASALIKKIPNVTAVASQYNQQQVQLAAKSAADQAAYAKKQADYQQWLRSPDGIAYTQQQQREKELAANQYALKYPYLATLTCKQQGAQLPVLACLTNNISSSVLELKNGNEYGMYQWMEMQRMSKSQNSSESIQLDLRPTFHLKIQNAMFNGVLQLVITERATGRIVFQKDATQWKYIDVSN